LTKWSTTCSPKKKVETLLPADLAMIPLQVVMPVPRLTMSGLENS
jgi:hypothetical protein